MTKLDSAERREGDRDKAIKDEYDLVSAGSVEHQQVVERGTERDKDIPRSTRDRVRYFNSICSRVTDNLFLGSDMIARNDKVLDEHKITHIVNCAATVCNDYFPSKYEYKTYHLLDGKTEDITVIFLDVMEYIHQALSENGKIFIHCQQGISRSSTALICYLMWLWKKPAAHVHEEVKKLRNISCPNAGFYAQLLKWQKVLSTNAENRPTELYMVHPHNLVAPDVLILKKVEATTDALDPRGVFILVTSKALYTWEGAKAHPACMARAKEYLVLMRKFLDMPDVDVPTTQGAEPADFWKALGADTPPAAIAPCELYDGKMNLLGLYDRRNEHWEPTKDAERLPFKVTERALFFYQCHWDTVTHQVTKDFLCRPNHIFAVLTYVGAKRVPTVYLWLGSQYDMINDREVENSGLQLLTRNEIFMATSDYKIYVVRGGHELQDFWTELSPFLSG
eukprot:CAMPEP_0119119732 /NCGR_PEP_ID=MMETSP1310-20130426/1092_1 /TAXON_ID=464262 /ORGANISM="Genus nov. species nov., Strain RCC2339" /LENGTH=450 /DNA_ID=CAMNT_0007109179 /DNA_START=59 /DNA_END=1411 /DNA_ORIENTATION=+